LLSIVGLGLLGGSLGLAARAAGYRVHGYARRPETTARALERGAIDAAAPDLAAAAQAPFVVLAVPVRAARDLLGALAPHLPPGAVLTDVGSTKLQMQEWARELLPAPPAVHYVGGHPIAGKETAGIEHADGALFRGRTWCVVPPPGADPGAVQVVEQLATAMGSVVLRVEAAAHDRAVAITSHLPFLVAVDLAETVLGRPDWDSLRPLAGTGLRDTTRLASGDVAMHLDICLTNREPLLRQVELFANRLAELADLLRLDEEALRRSLERAKRRRDTWVGQTAAPSAGRPENPGPIHNDWLCSSEARILSSSATSGPSSCVTVRHNISSFRFI